MVFFRYFLLAFLFLCCQSAHGQDNFYDDAPKPFSGGVAAGLNLAQVDGDKYFGYHKPGISAGFLVQAHLTPKFGVGMEILFSQKGSRGDAVTVSLFGDTSIARCHIGLSYIEVPVVLQYRYGPYGLEAGASYSQLIRTNEWIIDGQEVPIDKVANRFNSTDINYVFGLSRRVHKKLCANIRFQYSVISIRPMERIPAGYGYGTKGQFNNLFCVRLMYLL